MDNHCLNAPVWAISRHRISTDGRGIVTLVTFDGCPLDCAYCINPQSKSTANNEHAVLLTPTQLYERIRKDNLYCINTGGGVTFGGGEPLLRSAFIKAFARVCHSKLKLRIETSLNVPPHHVSELLDVIDHWYVDIKDLNPTIYNRYTGRANNRVLDNLQMFREQKKTERVTLRIPLIPDYNSENDTRASMQQLRQMGFEHFDPILYLRPDQVREKHQNRNPQRGKSICRILKGVRTRIAERYGIPYTPHVCTYDGPCLGTCPRCEQEVRFLEGQIHKNVLRKLLSDSPRASLN